MIESEKRRPPAVPPLELNGVRYEVPRSPRALGHTQASGVLAAVSLGTGEVLWSIAVYRISYGGAEEQDAQDVFITEIVPDDEGQSLIVTNEASARYRIILLDRRIERLP